MATAAVQTPTGIHGLGNASQYNPSAPIVATKKEKVEMHDVETELHFFKDNEDGSPPHPAYANRPETHARPVATHKVTIKDVSGDENKYTLDGHGFQFHRHISEEKDFFDDAQIKDRYYKEVDQLLKDVTGATRTLIFDHTIRRESDSHPTSGPNEKKETNAAEVKPIGPIRGPVKRVHIDQSYEAALSRVPFHLPEDAEHLLKGRVQLINVWRPIRTVRRDPLAVAQAQTVAEQDLVKIGLIYEKRSGETLGVRYTPQQQYYYKHHQTPADVLLIKCFDNKAGVESAAKYAGRAKRVPHTAFEVPGTETEETRQSIEVRCLVFHEDDVE